MKRNLFNSIKLTRPKTARFDLTHDVKLSCNMGQLVPVMATETMPGDKFKISAESLIRFAPLIAPVMHRMDVSIHYFFVPNRILWNDWEFFITNTDSVLHPYVTITDNYNKLFDYMGIPQPDGVHGENINALPFAAYQRIWWEYYRDQNLQPDGSYPKPLLEGGNNTSQTSMFELRYRAWEHDYFTAALPWAQKGSTVDIPLGEGTVVLDPSSTNPGKFVRAASHTYAEVAGINNSGTAPNANVTFGSGGNAAVYDPAGSLKTTTEATTINDLRRAFRLQEWLERAARGGTRYVESILSNFGIKSSDARLQRPEYITGVKSPVVISEVLNTTGTDTLPQGNMAGHGISIVGGNFGSYSCEEHGWIIGIMSIMPKTAYQQGIQRNFLNKEDFLDYPWPTFANIGEQEVFNNEVYAFQADSNQVFGYVPRYAQYKFEQNRVAGEFRNSLSFWHLGRIFEDVPNLNEAFIKANPTFRAFAVTNPEVDHLYCHILNKVQAIRPLPYWGTPTI